MYERLEIGGYVIEFDREATTSCYAKIRESGPAMCGCAQCRNWIAGRHESRTPQLLHALESMSIAPDREIEVYEMPGQLKPHLYSGWYLFVGRIISGTELCEFPCGDMQLAFASRGSFAIPEFAAFEVAELRFSVEVDEYLTPEEYRATPRPK